MATQLSRRRLLSSLSDDRPVLSVSMRGMLAIAAACVAVVYVSLFAALYNARRDEADSERIYGDTRTLIESPAPDLAALRAELEDATDAMASAEALSTTSAIDPASDDATALLVTGAQDAGLQVRAITRIAPADIKSRDITYTATAIRIDVQGTIAQIDGFLYDLHRAEPAFIATLTSLSAMPTGLSDADIVFTVYTKVEPATPVAVATAGARR